MVTLENKAEMFTAQRRQFITAQFCRVFPGNKIVPVTRRVQAAEDIHQRGFTGAGLADNRHHFTGTDSQ